MMSRCRLLDDWRYLHVHMEHRYNSALLHRAVSITPSTVIVESADQQVNQYSVSLCF